MPPFSLSNSNSIVSFMSDNWPFSSDACSFCSVQQVPLLTGLVCLSDSPTWRGTCCTVYPWPNRSISPDWFFFPYSLDPSISSSRWGEQLREWCDAVSIPLFPSIFPFYRKPPSLKALGNKNTFANLLLSSDWSLQILTNGMHCSSLSPFKAYPDIWGEGKGLFHNPLEKRSLILPIFSSCREHNFQVEHYGLCVSLWKPENF